MRLRDSICAIIAGVEAARAVIDTDVLVGALISATGSNRKILRACFEGQLQPIIGETLFHEYEDVLSRTNCF